MTEEYFNKEALTYLNKHFTYTPDYKWWDAGKFMTLNKTPAGTPLKGDCEDYSFHVARYVLGDGSLKTFYKGLWDVDFEFWWVKTNSGGNHCILIDNLDDSAIDNWTKSFVSVEEMGALHKLKHKLPAVAVLWMLFAGALDSGVKKLFWK